MRLFIAIELSEPVKNQLCAAIGTLQAGSLRGNFTRRENLHLTLVFLGEQTRVHDVKGAMKEAAGLSFPLAVSGAGTFRRDGGDIWWCGVERSPQLYEQYEALCRSLRARGFSVEAREYRPHLTLGRQVAVREDFDTQAFAASIPPIAMPVHAISLMQSSRINGRLVYRCLYRASLQEGGEG